MLNLKYLEGQEWSLLDLDNGMQKAGYCSELDGDVKTWLNSGSVVYTFIDDVEQDLSQVILYFEVTSWAGQDEPEFKTVIKVSSVEVFS